MPGFRNINSAAAIVESQFRISAIAISPSKALGIESDGLAGIGDSSVEVTLFEIISASVSKSEGVLWIESDDLAVIADGSVEVALSRIGNAPAEKGESVLGIKPDSLVVIGDGSVEVALFRINIAPPEKGDGVLGIESDGVREDGDSPVKVAGPLLLGLLHLALGFCLGCRPRLAFLLRLNRALDCGFFVPLGLLPDISKGFLYISVFIYRINS